IHLKQERSMSTASSRRAAIAVSAPAGRSSPARPIAAALGLALLFGAAAAHARGRDQRTTCSALTALTFEGNTTVTSASEVTSGTLVTPNNLTLTNLPAFCRVQGLSKPTSDSSIFFEVWLPSATWNGKFLSSGEGGYAGVPNYTRLGLD